MDSQPVQLTVMKTTHILPGFATVRNFMIWVCFCTGVGFVPVGLVHAEPPVVLVFAPLPMETPETVVAQWKPLLDHLGRSLGVTVLIEYSNDYETVLEKMRAGKLDLAYLGPLPYVSLKEHFAAATPVVHFNEKNGRSTYTCAVIALV